MRTDEVLDTLPVRYYVAADPNVVLTFRDTLLHKSQWYDPTSIPWQWSQHLGIVATAARPLWLPWELRGGFNVGFRQVDLYKIRPADLRFYLPRLPYALLTYTQGASQNDAQIGALVSRTFANNVAFTLDYRRVSNLSAKEVSIHNTVYYSQPRASALALGIGLAWRPENRPYEGYLVFTNNTNLEANNGGITSDTVFNSTNNFTSSTNYLEGANTRMQDRALTLNQYYTLAKKTSDSTATQPKTRLQIHHTAEYQVYKFKFADVDPDLGFYDTLGTDERGLRHYLTYQKMENIAALRLNRAAADGETQYLEAGIQHAYYSVQQEPTDTAYQNLQLRGRLRLPLGKTTLLTSNAMLGLAFQQRGDYQIEATLQQVVAKRMRLSALFLNQLYSPSLMQQQTWISKRPVWNNDFNRTFETNLGGSIALLRPDSTGGEDWLKASLTYRILANYIYFDSTFTPQQSQNAVNILQIGVYGRFRIGIIHLDQAVIFTAASDIVRLPNIWSNSSLYTEFPLFERALLLKIGTDIRIHTAYRPDGYMPAIGQFYVQNNYQQQPYPAIDVYLAAKVRTFRFFAKLENATGFVTERVYYPTYRQPLPDRTFRFGVTLILAN